MIHYWCLLLIYFSDFSIYSLLVFIMWVFFFFLSAFGECSEGDKVAGWVVYYCYHCMKAAKVKMEEEKSGEREREREKEESLPLLLLAATGQMMRSRIAQEEGEMSRKKREKRRGEVCGNNKRRLPMRNK